MSWERNLDLFRTTEQLRLARVFGDFSRGLSSSMGCLFKGVLRGSFGLRIETISSNISIAES